MILVFCSQGSVWIREQLALKAPTLFRWDVVSLSVLSGCMVAVAVFHCRLIVCLSVLSLSGVGEGRVLRPRPVRRVRTYTKASLPHLFRTCFFFFPSLVFFVGVSFFWGGGLSLLFSGLSMQKFQRDTGGLSDGAPNHDNDFF